MMMETENLVIEFFIGRFKESGRLMERGKIVRLRLGKGKFELVACHHQFSGFGVR
jgi:hypothetical protein